jgi:hypothetical protein
MKKIKFGYYSWTDPRMRNPRNYSIPQEKYRGAHVQKLSPWATNKGEPGKVLTRAPCAKIRKSSEQISRQFIQFIFL